MMFYCKGEFKESNNLLFLSALCGMLQQHNLSQLRISLKMIPIGTGKTKFELGSIDKKFIIKFDDYFIESEL